MKHIFLLAYFLFPCFTKGQDSTIQRSKFEEFTSRTGVLIKTETFEAGNQKDYKVSVTKATDIESNLSSKAIYIYQSKNMIFVGPYKVSVLYIDWEEVPAFIKALKLQQSLLDTKPQNEIDYTYTTVNGVVATCSYTVDGVSKGWVITFHKIYKHLGTMVANSLVMVKKKDFEDIISLLDVAIKKDY